MTSKSIPNKPTNRRYGPRVDALVVPGSSERMLVKAAAMEVAEVVIDLEDAVIPERKTEALALTMAALKGGFAAELTAVRVNPTGSPWVHVELIALASAEIRPDAVVVPKVSDARDLAFVDLLLDGAEAAVETTSSSRRPPMKIQALIETADGIANLTAIASASMRLEALIVGYADLVVSLGRSGAEGATLESWAPIQTAIVTVARMGGLRAIDGPILTISDLDGLVLASRQAASVGFDGKWAIHPAQIEPIRRGFAPSDQEIAEAQAVLDAIASAQAAGSGAVSLNGKMIDEPVRLSALRTLARAGVCGPRSD